MPAGAEAAFSQQDIEAFAAASGDFNPIHVDPLVARRLLGGATLVHGVHALLWALCGPFGSRGRRLASLDATFRQAIRVGDRVTCAASDVGPERVRLLVLAEGREVLTASLALAPDQATATPGAWAAPPRDECRQRSAADVAAASGAIALGLDGLAMQALLPSLGLPPEQVAALASISRLVGMECPGRDSLLHRIELRWEAAGGRPTALAYRAEGYDPRFASLRMRVGSAGLEGRVEAFLRPGPVAQPTAVALLARLEAGEFSGERSLVVGGSRGLGEVTAKLLGAGGADVRLTYRLGREDAERVCAEIGEAGGRAQALAFDVLDASARLEGLGAWSPTQLYYFPTPYISLNETTRFSDRLFRRYCGYYVEGLVRTLDAVLGLGNQRLAVFYPSTTALDDVLPKALEYAAAKGAGEVACRHLEKLDPRLRVRVSRLPRVRTDTTASMLPVDAREAADVMLPELRALRTGSSSRGEGSGGPR
jgi:NADP-dependent 3-hydroxy acid dehydrogenase YdfG